MPPWAKIMFSWMMFSCFFYHAFLVIDDVLMLLLYFCNVPLVIDDVFIVDASVVLLSSPPWSLIVSSLIMLSLL